jgi:hypothetical protein
MRTIVDTHTHNATIISFESLLVHMVPPTTAVQRRSKRRAAQSVSKDAPTEVAAGKATASGNNAPTKRPRSIPAKVSIAAATTKTAEIALKTAINVNDDDDDTSSKNTVVSFYFPKEPASLSRGREYYDVIHIALKSCKGKETFTVRCGDTLRLTTESGKQVFCRVYRFMTRATKQFVKSNKKENVVKVEGHWLLHRNDLVKQLGETITPCSQEFVNQLGEHELVLTKTSASLNLSGIEGIVRLLYIRPNEHVPTALRPNEYVCRFTLDFDAVNKTLDWGTLDMEPMDVSPVENEIEDVFNKNSLDDALSSSIDDDDSDSTVSIEEVSKVTIQEGGGASLRSEIRVGSNFQVEVKPFVPGHYVQTRQPVLVYKAHAISDDDLFQFLNSVADLHNEYLRNNSITMDEPYTPLRHSRAEEVMQELPETGMLTGSSMSTASMLAGSRCRLQKECDADAVLEILAWHVYDTKAALATIQSSLHRITVGWTRPEKDIFDDGFRRNSGSLRIIAKAITPTKTMKDVIDYFYRFKVSDQFRKFQDKKRKLAVRMVECIESRKYYESPSSNNGATALGLSGAITESFEQPSHWSEKSISNILETKDQRVRAAKQLLIDVKDSFGSKKMAEVASVVRQLQECYEPVARSFLFKLLDGEPELQKRFLGFLPKHF